MAATASPTAPSTLNQAPKNPVIVEKYVIRADLVWKHKRGAVVAATIANFPPGTDYDHLVLNRAIRPAMPSEYDMTVVDVDANLKAGISLTEQINEAQATTTRLQRENEELKLKQAELLKMTHQDFDPAVEQRALMERNKYEEVIQTLNLANKQQAGELETLRRMLNEKTNGKPAK